MSRMLTIAAGVPASIAMVGMLAACENKAANAPVTTTTATGQSTAVAPAAAERANTALVRFVQAVPAGGAMDLYADDMKTFDGVPYRETTPYREIDGQYYTFRLRPAGRTEGDAAASNTEGLDDGDYYTVFAVPGDRDTAVLRVVEDDVTPPDEARARVRVVHAVRSLGEIDVFKAGSKDKVFGGVDFQSVSDYDEIEPWTGGLDVRAAGNDSALATVNVQFAAGKVYTIVVVANPRGGAAPDAFVIEDQPGVPRTPATATGR